MHQRKLGPFHVSAIGLGCMNISMGYGPRPDDEECGNLFNLALDNGYTMLDTAAMYGMGHSESIIGKYLSHRRYEYTLASKCGIFRNEQDKAEVNCRPEVLLKTCEDSLRRLNTDVIDLYYLHRVDTNVPVEESIGALSRMVEQGKVRTIGTSEIGNENLRKAHATHPLIAVQSEYSLWTRTPERKVLTTCEDLGISFVAFAPLARQFLTGKCTDLSHFDENDIRCTNARPRFEPENFAQNEKLLTPYSEIANRLDCSMAQLALAWLLARGDNIIPIPGTKHVDYMIENAGAGDISLDPETVEELDQLINENTVSGDRYQSALMKSIDSEKD